VARLARAFHEPLRPVTTLDHRRIGYLTTSGCRMTSGDWLTASHESRHEQANFSYAPERVNVHQILLATCTSRVSYFANLAIRGQIGGE
jgi:outer membrane protease